MPFSLSDSARPQTQTRMVKNVGQGLESLGLQIVDSEMNTLQGWVKSSTQARGPLQSARGTSY